MPEVSIQTEPTPQEEARNETFDVMASLDHDLATLLEYTNRLIHNQQRVRRAVMAKESLPSPSPQSATHPEDPEDPPSLEIPSLSSPPEAPFNLRRTRYSDLVNEFIPPLPSSFAFTTNGSLIRLTSNDSLVSPSSSSHSSPSTPSSPSSVPLSSPLTSPSSKNHRFAPY